MRKDIEILIKDNKVQTFGFKKSIENVQRYLSEDEVVKYVNITNISETTSKDIKINPTSIKGKTPAIVIITDRRLIFYFIVIGNETMKQFPLTEIREYSFNRQSIFGSTFRITTLQQNFDLDIKWKKGAIDNLIKALEDARNKKQPTIQTQDSDFNESLRKLAKLKEDGIITDVEFKAQKEKILNNI